MLFLTTMHSLYIYLFFSGDEPEHSDPSTAEFYVARVGYQVYCEYQKQLLLDLDGGCVVRILSLDKPMGNTLRQSLRFAHKYE